MGGGGGGLLDEIPSRPWPRDEGSPAPAAEPAEKKLPPRGHSGPRIAALLLAAGQSSRMGSNKLLAEVDGRPMVARVAQRLLSSHARPIVAVLGNEAARVDAALGKLPVERGRNPALAWRAARSSPARVREGPRASRPHAAETAAVQVGYRSALWIR